MKKLILLCIIALMNFQVFASHKLLIAKDLNITIDFAIQATAKDGRPAKSHIQNIVNIPTKNHQWLVVPIQAKDKPNNYMLLSQIKKAGSHEVKLNFLVIANGDNPTVISQPQLRVRYDQEAKLTFAESGRQMQLIVNVKPQKIMAK
jgi:hypothetical protein